MRTQTLGLFYYSMELLPLADAVALNFVSPSLTALLAWVVLRERLGWLSGLGVLVSLAGVFLQSQPPFLFPNQETKQARAGRHWRTVAQSNATVFAGSACVTGCHSQLS